MNICSYMYVAPGMADHLHNSLVELVWMSSGFSYQLQNQNWSQHGVSIHAKWPGLNDALIVTHTYI